MGGRGAASGESVSGARYGTEYKTILAIDNIKFVQQRKPGSAAIPRETMSAGQNRVYVLVNSRGELKSITFYNKEGKLRRQIEFGHKGESGKGKKTHVHMGYDHDKVSYKLPKSDKAYMEKVRRVWKQR